MRLFTRTGIDLKKFVTITIFASGSGYKYKCCENLKKKIISVVLLLALSLNKTTKINIKTEFNLQTLEL